MTWQYWVHWVTLGAWMLLLGTGAFRVVIRRQEQSRRQERVRERETMASLKKTCPGRLDPDCACHGACIPGRWGWCGCPPCTAFAAHQPGALAAGGTGVPDRAPVPRHSGPGMSGFAGQRTEEFPLALGSVTGLRMWTLQPPDLRLDPHEADVHWPAVPLTGATGFYWPAGALEAVCNNGRPHLVPTEADATGRCGCGFYAYWDMAALGANSSNSNGLPVLGTIEGFGRTLIGERGFRCQRARICALAPAFAVLTDFSWPARDWGSDPYLSYASERRVTDEVKHRAQQHADAWMAVIQDRLGQSYPGAAVYATVNGLLASEPTRGKL